MSNIEKVAAWGVAIVLAKFVYNLYYLLLAKFYLRKYEHYIFEDRKDWYISDHKKAISTLIKRAGIEDTTFPYVEPVGWGHIQTARPSVMANLDAQRKDVVQVVGSWLREAQAIFRSRMVQGLNPIYWIELVLYFPREVLSYLGIPRNNWFIKLFQLVWWLLGFVATVSSVFFNTEFTRFIENLLTHF